LVGGINIYKMSFEVIVEKIHNNSSNNFTISGKKDLYEESYDGSHAGWYKFRKDIASQAGYKNDNWIIEIQDQSSNWILVQDGPSLNPFLDTAATSGKMNIKIQDVTVVSKSKGKQANQKDVEKGLPHDQHTKTGCQALKCCFWPIRFVLLVIIYILLFAFWLVGILGALVIDIFWCPFKIICPLCCPCFCCIEEIQKELFSLVLWVLKSPIRLARHFLVIA